MGAACETICSRKSSTNHIQPDTETMKSRKYLSPNVDDDKSENSFDSIFTPDGVTRSPNKAYQIANKLNKTSTLSEVSEGNNIQYSISQEFQDAIKQGNETMITFFLEEYPDMRLLTTPFTNNDTCVHLSVKYKQYHLLEKFLEDGASVNAKNVFTENTPLHVAVTKNDIKSVQILLRFGADAYISNVDDDTPLNIAHRYRYEDILRCFGEEMKSENNPRFTAVNTLKLKSLCSDILAESPQILIGALTESNEEYLQSLHTARLNDVTSDLFREINESISERTTKLHPLNGWLHKKQNKGISWQKRWVFVGKGCVLWSDRQITMSDQSSDHISHAEKKRWNKSFALRNIKTVERIDKKARLFKVKVRRQDREYIFKCANSEECEQWIEELSEHVRCAKLSSVYSSRHSLSA